MEGKFTTYKDILGRRNRKPSFRQVQAMKSYLDGNGRKSKAEALREAGYSESVADHPDKVFGGRAVLQLMEELGVTSRIGIEILKRNATAMIPSHFIFPSFRDKNTEGENEGENFGEQITDKEIREYLEGAGHRVTKIVHGDIARHVYCYHNDSKTQLATADTIFKLCGDYAPKKVEGKHDHKVGIFSMRDLREKMRENGIKVTDPVINGKVV